MITSANSQRLFKSGILSIDPDSGAVLRIIALQYSPDTPSRTLEPQVLEGEVQ
jgi:hypothetical protein